MPCRQPHVKYLHLQVDSFAKRYRMYLLIGSTKQFLFLYCKLYCILKTDIIPTNVIYK